ncbi:MAG: helix-turn-helix domain-containing protein [Nitrospiraceae bacterium]|nr:helix-turn-helix domain-containing protein [Nitrospiraceae bacterium]
MMIENRLLTVEETAQRLGLKPATIRRMIFQRRIDTVRPSVRAVRIPEAAIKKILEQGYRPAVPMQGKDTVS